MLIITGTGRCGTSLVARFTKEMGYDPGGHWEPSINAGYEHPDSCRINHEIAGRYRRSGKKGIEKFVADKGDLIRGFSAAVIKDPRFVVMPAVLETWARLRSDLRFVLLYRNPLDAVRSSRRFLRTSANAQDLGTHVANTRANVQRAVQAMLDAGVQFRVLYFPAILDDYRAVHDALVTFGGLDWDYRIGQAHWRSIVRPELVHFRDGRPVPQSDSQARDVPKPGDGLDAGRDA